MLYVFVFNFNIIAYSQFIQSDIIQICCSIKNINTEYIIFLPDFIIFASRAVDIPTGDTHIDIVLYIRGEICQNLSF